MALADATVRVILDVSRFDRDLETKVAAAARRAGRRFESEFAKTAKTAGARWSKDFGDQAKQGMTRAGESSGKQYGSAVRRAAKPTGRLTGRELGEQIRGGLLNTATLTGRQYGRGLLSGSITEAGSRIGQRLGRAIGDNLDTSNVGVQLRARIERDAEPGLLAAARTVGSRFGNALGTALSATSIGRMGFLVAGVAGLVSEGTQLAAALEPGLQAIGLFPAALSVATASITTFAVAFRGMGTAFDAVSEGKPEKIAQAMEKLTPAAQKVVREFEKLLPQLTGVRKAVQQAFFAPLVGDLTNLGEALLGPVQRGMSAAGAAAGRLTSGLAEVFAETRSAIAIEEIFNSAATAFDRMGGPLMALTQGMLEFTRATLPAFDQLVASLGSATARFGNFLSAAAASGQAMVWVNEAITTISQLGRISLSAGRLVRTIFSAANEVGGNYLLTLNNALIATRQFLAVGEGRTALVSIFEGIHEVVRALAEPLRAAVVAIGQVSRVAGDVSQALSGGLAAAIRGIGQAVTNAGPGLTRFAEAVGGALSDLGDVLPSIGSSLGRLLAAAAPLVSVFGVVANVAASLLSVFSSLPGPVLTVIAAFASLRALGVPDVLAQIRDRAAGSTSVFSSMTSSVGRMTDVYRANMASLTAARIQQQVANNAMSAGIPTVNRFSAAVGTLADRARAAGTAVGGPLLRGAQGLIGALGGGIGIAITAASVLIGLWASEQQKADQAVAEHNQRVRQLGSTLDKVTGSITNATRAQAQQTFSSADLADSARNLGLSIDRVADAATGSETAQRRMLDQIRNSARGALQASGDWDTLEASARNLGVSSEDILNAMLGNEAAFKRVSKAADENGARIDAITGSYGQAIPDQIALGNAINRTATDLKRQGDAIREANAQMTPAQRLAESLATAMGTLADNSSSAADKARALDTALRLLNGGTLEVADAQKAAADAVASGNAQIQAIAEKYKIAGRTAADLGISTGELAARQADLKKALFDSSGQIDFTSERARGLYDVAKQLRQATLDQTAAVIDNAQKTGGDMGAAYKRAADMMKASREQIVQWATAAGFGATDAAKLADAMGLIPENVRVAVEMQNLPAIVSQLGEIRGEIQLLPNKKSLRLDSNARKMRGELEDLGFLVEDIPGSKDIKITPNTDEAAAAVRTFILQQIQSRDADFHIGANIDAAKASAAQLEQFIKQLPASIKPGLETGPVIADWQNLLLGPLHTPPGTPTVTPGIDGGQVTNWFDTYLQNLAPVGDPTVTPGLDPSLLVEGLGLVGEIVPPGKPTITPGVDGAPAEGQMEGLLEGLGVEGQPEITPRVNAPKTGWLEWFAKTYGPGGAARTPEITPKANVGPASFQLDNLLKPPPEGTPRITPAANTEPAQGKLQTLLFLINNSRATGPTVGGNTAPANAQLALLMAMINRSRGNVAVSANTSQGYAATNALVSYANRTVARVDVGAGTGLAYAQVNELVRYINSRSATVQVNTSSSIRAAEGGLFKYFAGGGINQMRSMPANRAEIVPPKTMRVIGDRARGDEAFIPLVNSARSHSILRAAASRLGFDVTPRSERQATTTRTTTVEAGAIVVQAPYSDPALVARAVLNELTREAVP